MNVCRVFSLESPHWGDSNEYTQHTIFNVKKRKNHPWLSKICSCGIFSKGLKNEFETAVVDEQSVFEPLKFYCILILASFLSSQAKDIRSTLILTYIRNKVYFLSLTSPIALAWIQKKWPYSMARALMARLPCQSGIRSWASMVPYTRPLWSNFWIVIFSFSIFSDRRPLNIENAFLFFSDWPGGHL